MIRSLFRKEWHEQRVRFLVAMLLSIVLVWFVVYANVLTLTETLVIALVPIGMIAAPAFAVAAHMCDREDGSHRFMAALPVSSAERLRVKWAIGVGQLLVLFAALGLTASIAAASRGMLAVVPIPDSARRIVGGFYPEGNRLVWLWFVVSAAAVSFIAWYTILVHVLARARAAPEALIGAVLLTTVMIAWLVHGLGLLPQTQDLRTVVSVSALIHPLSPLLTLTEPLSTRAGAYGIAIVLWTILPVWLSGLFVNRMATT